MIILYSIQRELPTSGVEGDPGIILIHDGKQIKIKFRCPISGDTILMLKMNFQRLLCLLIGDPEHLGILSMVQSLSGMPKLTNLNSYVHNS